MVRVCAVGGRVVVCDMYASVDPVKAATWNKLEKLRDPSHVRPGGGRRHDGKPDAVLHHAAHRLEARQAHAELKPPAEARGIVLDVLLQRAAGAEEFICPGCQP